MVELRRHLNENVPLDKLNSLLFEAKNHLESLSEEFQSHGMDRRAAELASIDRFGAPNKVAGDFLLSLREVRERRLILVAAVATAFLIPYLVYRAYTGNSYFSISVATGENIFLIAGALGLYALIRGKVPKFRWFAYPLALIVLLGSAFGFSNTFYRSPENGLEYPTNYSSLHEQYLTLRSQHRDASALEHEAVADWQKAMASDDGIAAGSKLSLPRITFEVKSYGQEASWPGSQVQPSHVGNNPYVRYWKFNTPVRTVMDPATSQKRFNMTPKLFRLEIAGPKSGKEVRSLLMGRVEEVRNVMEGRQRILGSMQNALNISVLERAKKMIGSFAPGYLFFAAPLAWLLSLILSKARNLFLFRSRRTRLA